ncbi:hypothetical protein ACO0SA_004053 [Hanseniaspora valbyensis]
MDKNNIVNKNLNRLGLKIDEDILNDRMENDVDFDNFLKEQGLDFKLSGNMEKTPSIDSKSNTPNSSVTSFYQKPNSLKRKRHKNTRFGCTECKNRRIKCDCSLKLLTGGIYTCLNCLLKWKRTQKVNNKKSKKKQKQQQETTSFTNINDPDSTNKYNVICSFSLYSFYEIKELKKQIHEKELMQYEEMNSLRLYPITEAYECVNNDDEEQQKQQEEEEIEEDPENVNVQKVFKVTLIPHEKIDIQPSLREIKPLLQKRDQVDNKSVLSKICFSAMNFVNEETASYYTCFALNTFLAKLKKFYITDLKGMDAVYGEDRCETDIDNDHMLSFACFRENRFLFEKEIDFFTATSTFQEKRILILRYIKVYEELLKIKLSLSYKAISTLLNFIIAKKELVSPALILNCHIGAYILKNFELYSLVTDKNAMSRFIEHYCSSFDIAWNLVNIKISSFVSENVSVTSSPDLAIISPAELKNKNEQEFFINKKKKNSTWDFIDKEFYSNYKIKYDGDKIGFAVLNKTMNNQSFLHMKSYPLDFLKEVMKMLTEFGDIFLFSLPTDQIDSILKEDFKNLVLFLEYAMKLSVFVDYEKALPLQPNLVSQINHRLLSIMPKKLLLISQNEYMHKETLCKILIKHQISKDSFGKYSNKNVVKDYNELGLITPVEKILYTFYFLVDVALSNCFATNLYVFDNGCYDFDEESEVDKKVLFFGNYSFRLITYMQKRKFLMSYYCCLNPFYQSKKEEDVNLINKNSSEMFLQQPCYISRQAYNIKETPIANFLTTRFTEDSYFSIDDKKMIPLELVIGFESCYQKFQKYPYKGSNVLQNGHYWDGHFYLILKESYLQYKENLKKLMKQYGKAIDFYFAAYKQNTLDEVSSTFIKDLARHDINKAALKNVNGKYKYQETLITENEIDDIETSLQNLLIIYQYFINMNILLPLSEKTFQQLGLKLKRRFEDNTIDYSESKTSDFSTSTEDKPLLNNLFVYFPSNTLSDDVLMEHKKLKLSLLTGLFASDYDPILNTTTEKYLLSYSNLDFDKNENQEKWKDVKKESSLDLFPNLDFVKMVRKDKMTLLFADGRDDDDDEDD